MSAKSQIAASNGLPLAGTVLITVNDPDKPTVTPIARRFHEMGFEILATSGTEQVKPGSGLQSAEQPSPSMLLPSSQASPSTMPSPHFELQPVPAPSPEHEGSYWQ